MNQVSQLSQPSSQTSASLRAEGLTIRRGRRTILRDVDARIDPGRVVAILGANGAGKSTLLRALSGDLQPELGRVELDGRPLADWPRLELARRRATTGPSMTVNFPFFVRELVALGRHPHAPDPRWDARCVDEALALAGAEVFAERRYNTLSTGERQRVQVARALAQIWAPEGAAPRWLLLDEPTANLDLSHSTVLLERLRELCSRGIGLAIIVHDINLALRFADEVILLAEGGILFHGPPPRFFDQPELLRRGFGLDADVLPHPRGGWPVVLPMGAVAHPSTARPERTTR